MDKVITISRQYGSGGREIGKRLAEAFQVPFYDNELITRAAKESGFAEAAFQNAESKATSSLLYSIAMGMNAYGNHEFGFSNLSLEDRIFLAQSEVIRKIASEGPCVIVGRCADYILKEMDNVVNVFVWADMKYRVERAINCYGLPEAKAQENIQKFDKIEKCEMDLARRGRAGGRICGILFFFCLSWRQCGAPDFRRQQLRGIYQRRIGGVRSICGLSLR